MKINTTTILTQVTGVPFMNGVEGNNQPLTLGFALANILATSKSTDPVKSYTLAKKLYSEPEVELTPEDIVFVKSVVPESQYVPFILGLILDTLNGNAQ